MSHKRYSTEGIILSKINYGEADRILSILTKDQGKVRVIAKGVRKVKSRKRGHIEVLNQIKFSAVNTYDLDLITEADLIESFSEVKKDLKKVSVAYYLVEIISKLLEGNEKNDLLYYLLLKKLHELNETRSLKEFRYECAREILTRLGFWPHGQTLLDPDELIEEVIEKKLHTTRVGKAINT
jgi:DNA repair protein RecO (recombination protein O)